MLNAILPLACLLLPPASSPLHAQSSQQVMLAASKASGAAFDKGAWSFVGTCREHGADDKFEFDFDDMFRFKEAATGSLIDVTGYDGNRCWSLNWSRIPHYVGLEEQDVNEMLAWVIEGVWSLPGVPLDVTPDARERTKFTLLPKGGHILGTLSLASDTALPKTLTYTSGSGFESWTFTGFRKFGARNMPTHIAHHVARQDEQFDLSDGKKVASDVAAYSLPKADLSDTSFDTALPSRVELKRIGGYMFVKPAVDGKDIGWFFLDSGADVMCLDTEAAKKLTVANVGADTTAGVVAVVQLPIVRAQSFQLGPLHFKDPTFEELDLSDFGKALNVKVGGICGYDFIARAVLDIDPAVDALNIYKPGSSEAPDGVHWEGVVFNGETPCISCKFEGEHEGTFSLDTGSNSSVDFFSPTVERLKMLAKRATRTVTTGGAGGSADAKQGPLDYFEIGGKRFEKPDVGFQTTKSGVFSSECLEGNVGMGFLGSFRLIFDYSNDRIGFIPKTG